MTAMSQPYWFKRRRYGWGWIPVTWQGWLTVGIWLLLVIGGATAILDVPEAQQARESAFFLLFIVVATAGLIRISYAKGPKPRWRWGKKPDDNPEEDF